MDTNHVKIFDTTLRDGEQAPGNSMNLNEKLRFAKQLEKLGVDIIEAGFPISSPEDFESVKKISQTVKTPEVCGLARALKKDIDCAWDAIQEAKHPRIHTFIATSDIHMEYKLKKTPNEVLQMAIDAVTYAKSLCDSIEFSPEDSTRSNPDFLYKVLEAVIDAGATTLNIPDTVGYGLPKEFGELIAGIVKNVPNIEKATISTHCHDDLGLATANSLSGVLNGARQVECTVNGIGERAGNAALEEIAMAIKTRKDFFHLETNINTKEIQRSSFLLTSITGVPVQPNKAIVGSNAFAHESGIHQDGVLKKRTTYEIMHAKDVGLATNNLVLGKHSGRHALITRLEELGYTFSEDEINDIFKRFKILADKKKEIFDEDLQVLADDLTLEETGYKLKDITIVTGTQKSPHAVASIITPEGNVVEVESDGNGPVNAGYKTVDKVIKIENTLLEYFVNPVTEGIDAQAIVSVKIRIDDKIYPGTSSDTDIIVGSVKAYINALNKARNR